MSQKNNKSKTTSEKPVSLNPLNLEQALAGLLKVRPAPTDKKKRGGKQKGKSKKKGEN